jgi:hypothetical protein
MEPTLKTYPNGTQEWRLNGNRHREDGPAIIRPDGTQVWYLNDKRHREDGPAIIWSNGTKEWWLNEQSFIGKMVLLLFIQMEHKNGF